MKKNVDFRLFPKNQQPSKPVISAHYQPIIDHSYYNETQKFLEQIVKGNHLQINSFLVKNLILLTRKTTITDSAGRIFKDITGYEYALWASDDLTLKIILAFLQDKGTDCKFIPIVTDLYNAWYANGITYKNCDGLEVNEHCFNFENEIFKPMAKLINFLACSENTQQLTQPKIKQTSIDPITGQNILEKIDDLDNIWSQVVMGQQRLPLHIIHLYCCNRVFYPIGQLSLYQPECVQQFYDLDNKKLVDWFSTDTSAINRIIIKGCTNFATGIARENTNFFGLMYLSMKRDLVALKQIINDKNQSIQLLNSLAHAPMIQSKGLT